MLPFLSLGPCPQGCMSVDPRALECHRVASFTCTTLPVSHGLLTATLGGKLFPVVEPGLQEDKAGQWWGQVCWEESHTGHGCWVQSSAWATP